MIRSNHQSARKPKPSLLAVSLLFLTGQAVFSASSQAAPPRTACNLARLNTERVSDGVRYRCNVLVDSRGRRTYRWQRALPTPVGPGDTTTTTRLLTGGSPTPISTGDIECLALGNNRTHIWVNDDSAYWQNILNQKTESQGERVIRFTGGRKDVWYENGTLTLLGVFQGVGVLAPELSAYSRRSLILEVRPVGGFLVVDAITRNEIVLGLEFNGTSLPPTRTSEPVTIGFRFPFKCSNNLLAITEQGISGPVTTTYGLRPVG
jgi:hypothetical protein